MEKKAKKDIEEKLDYFKVYREVTFDSSIVSVTDQNGTILVANENFCKISGYSKEELIGQNHRIVNSGFHSKEFFKELWETLLSGQKWQGEICNRDKNGTLYWVDTNITPVFNKEKGEYEFISIRLEITHRKRFEDVSKRIQEVANIGYWEWLVSSNTLYWSEEVYRIHGQDPSTYVPTVEDGINHYAPEYIEVIKEAVENGAATGQGWDLELQILNKNKERVWVRAVGLVEKAENQVFRLYGTFQDIDKKKRVQIELVKSQMQLKLAVEAAGICSWVYIPFEDKLTWDDAAYGVFGIDRSKTSATFKEWLELIIPEDREATHKDFISAINRKEEIYNGEFQIDHPQNGRRFIKGRALITYDSYGNASEIIGLNWDISQEKNLETTLVKAREKAVEATRAKSAFLASMSHEIRTPMNGLMGTLELFSETNLNKEQKELFETVQMSGDQLLNVVNDILDFSKIEAGKLELEYRNFDLGRLLKGVRSIFEVQAAKKGIEISISLAPDVPRFIMGDDTRLKQILTNLVSNAIKFTNKGNVELYVERSPNRYGLKEKGERILFKVKDSGIGIPQEKQKKLFDSFSQVDATTTRKYGGSGLGLAICKSLVNSMGGNIGVESFKEGNGTIFFFEITTQVGEAIQEKERVYDQMNFKKDLKILLAEDNLTNQKLALSFLKKLGFDGRQITVANNGLEAFKKVGDSLRKKNPFDVVLMDMQMPEMDGVEASLKINEAYKDQAPIIIAMTANVFEEDKKRCLDAGMKAFATKPIKKAVLINLFNEFFFDEKVSHINKTSEPTMVQEFKYSYLKPEKILYEFGEDFDIFEELVVDYKSQVSEFVETIKSGIANGDAESIRVAGHTLKGIVGNFYCEKLKDAAFAIEVAGKSEDVDSVDAKLGIFMSLNELVSNELEIFLKENSHRSDAA